MQATYILGMKSVMLEGAWILEIETFDAPLLAESILISYS